jgi:hypothetical protein
MVAIRVGERLFQYDALCVANISFGALEQQFKQVLEVNTAASQFQPFDFSFLRYR